MPNNYRAPYLIDGIPAPIPQTGTFIVPVCTTAERFDKIMNALWYYGQQQDREFDFDHLIDWLDALPRIREGCEYTPIEHCNRLYPENERILWFPENPFSPEPEPPSGYTFHPFTVVTNSTIDSIVSVWGLGFKIGDVFTDLTKIPLGSSWGDILATYANMPHFSIVDLEGRGIVKLHLLNIISGGRALIIKDGVVDVFNLQAVELNRDNVSFPAETQVEIIIEVEFEGGGTHSLEVVFYPTVDDSLIPVQFGGGLRSVELCGFGDTMPDENCCDETNEKLGVNNQLLAKILSLMESGIHAEFRFGNTLDLPDFHQDCTPSNFDSNEGDVGEDDDANRAKSLCLAVAKYMQGILFKVASLYNAPQNIFDFILGLFVGEDLSPNMGNLLLQLSDTFTLLGLSEAATDVTFEAVQCAMIAALTGQENSFSAFKVSLNPTLFDAGTPEYELAKLIERHNAKLENYKMFAKELERGFTSDELEDYECPCGVTPPEEDGCGETPLDIVVYPIGGITPLTITNLGGNIYLFEQTVQAGSQENSYFGAFRDSLDRCMRVEAGGDSPQATQIYSVVGCPSGTGDCASSDLSGHGGFAPIAATAIGFGTTDPMHATYKITCCVPTP